MKLKVFVSFLITSAFLVAFLYLVPLKELIHSLSNIKPEGLFIAFILYSISQLLRCLRWKLLLKGLSLRDVFLINSANIFLNNLLPARAGELSWFYYTRKMGLEMRASLWSFLVGRGYDLLGMIASLFLSFAFMKGFILIAVFSGTILLVSALIPYTRMALPRKGKLGELRGFLEREFKPSLSVKLIALSTISFGLKALSVYVVLSSIIELELTAFLFAFTGGELTTILPVHGFMGYGTYETGFLLPLKVLGIQTKESLQWGFIAHSFLLLSSAVWGVVSIAWLNTLSRKYP